MMLRANPNTLTKSLSGFNAQNAARSRNKKLPPIKGQASLRQLQESRGFVFDQISGTFLELDKESMRPIAFPGGALKSMGKVHLDGKPRDMLAVVDQDSPYFVSLKAKQVGPISRDDPFELIIPFDSLAENGKTKHLNVIM